LSAALACDHRRDRIRVNVVVPGYTLTGMTEGDANRQRTTKNVTGRELSPQDTANVVAFLLSAEAEAISGSVTTVGGPLEGSRPL
jgi:NAD(P)-dependent dehydrogenase (short-subunit alcohol dehydrogenase family)